MHLVQLKDKKNTDKMICFYSPQHSAASDLLSVWYRISTMKSFLGKFTRDQIDFMYLFFSVMHIQVFCAAAH